MEWRTFNRLQQSLADEFLGFSLKPKLDRPLHMSKVRGRVGEFCQGFLERRGDREIALGFVYTLFVRLFFSDCFPAQI